MPEVAVAQAIPVGQSIDSAEYADLGSKHKEQNKAGGDGDKFEEQNQEATRQVNKDGQQEEGQQAGIEEAAIKIQAFVRGHLTRKALKDGHYHSLPQPNALGQSQFDEESLIQNRK